MLAMRWIASALAPVLFCLALVGAPNAAAQIKSQPARATAAVASTPESDQIRSWYRDYLGREVGPEISAWVELLRGGMSATDVQATILGSDEFYYAKGRDPQTFVLETLQAVTWSEPTVSELRRWTDRLTQLRGDRFAVAREIVLAQGQQTSPGTEVDDTALRLMAASRLLIDTIHFEIGGTSQGRQAHLRAQAIHDSCHELQEVLAIRNYRPADALSHLDAASRSLQSLETTLNNPPGSAPSAAGIARRIGTMLADARQVLRPAPTPTPTPTPVPGGNYDQQRVLSQIAAVKRGTDSLIQMLTSQAYSNYTYSIVLRDLDTFAAGMNQLEDHVRRATSRDRLQWELETLRDQANRIEPQLLAGRPPYFVRLYWQSVESSLDQLRDTLGAATGDGSTVLRPTQLHEAIMPLIDQAIQQVDVFLTGTNPLIYGVPDVPSVQRDVRNLRTRLLTMRQQAIAGESAGVLQQSLNQMVGDYQAAFSRWNQIVAAYNIDKPARLSPVGETLNLVERMINEAIAGGDVSSGGTTQVSSVLVSLDGELAGLKTAVVPFNGYPEQRAMNLYVEQCQGYVLSIRDSQADATTSIDTQRRLAAGMQRVIGLMHAEADSLNQRTLSVGTRDLQTRADDVRRRASRIGTLADELEAKLH
jgi:hypothetical protein